MSGKEAGEGEEEYSVEKVLDKRIRNGKVSSLILFGTFSVYAVRILVSCVFFAPYCVSPFSQISATHYLCVNRNWWIGYIILDLFDCRFKIRVWKWIVLFIFVFAAL